MLCGLALSADGKRALSAGIGPSVVRAWDLESGACVAVRGEFAHALALSADGTCALSATHDQTMRVWDLESGACVAVLDGHSGGVAGVALSADGTRAASGAADGTVRVWDLESGACVAVLDGHTGNADYQHARERFAERLDGFERAFPSGLPRRTRRLVSGRTRRVRALALSHDGTRAASASDDGTVRVWDADSGTCIAGPYLLSQAKYALALPASSEEDVTWLVTGEESGAVSAWAAAH
jgi:WD40 repeat protein